MLAGRHAPWPMRSWQVKATGERGSFLSRAALR